MGRKPPPPPALTLRRRPRQNPTGKIGRQLVEEKNTGKTVTQKTAPLKLSRPGRRTTVLQIHENSTQCHAHQLCFRKPDSAVEGNDLHAVYTDRETQIQTDGQTDRRTDTHRCTHTYRYRHTQRIARQQSHQLPRLTCRWSAWRDRCHNLIACFAEWTQVVLNPYRCPPWCDCVS